MREIRVKGMIIRSNTEWKVQGDKRITYLCNIAKRTFVDKIVPKIIRDSGTELINLNEIIKVQKEYYESLYKSKNKTETKINETKSFNRNNPLKKNIFWITK